MRASSFSLSLLLLENLFVICMGVFTMTCSGNVIIDFSGGRWMLSLPLPSVPSTNHNLIKIVTGTPLVAHATTGPSSLAEGRLAPIASPPWSSPGTP